MIRDLASCFGDHAVKVSDSTCAGSGRRAGGGSAANVSVTTLFRTAKELPILISWSRSPDGPAIAVAVAGDDPRLLSRRRGTCSYISGGHAVCLHWDIFAARYGLGPEPIHCFYVAVIVDGELCLLIGDKGTEFLSKFEGMFRLPNVDVIRRRETIVIRDSCGGDYSTTARFSAVGKEHEIWIRFAGGRRGVEELVVAVDRKEAVQARSLRWNFRGSQVLFVDGMVVDMMWDLHDWWFAGSGGGGGATFMFRTRSSPDARLWSEEEMEGPVGGFALVIQAFTFRGLSWQEFRRKIKIAV